MPQRRLLVTGGSSSLGREIVRQGAAGFDVFATYLSNPRSIPFAANPPYTEESTPRPLHVYGRAKVEGEEIVAAHQLDAASVRTSLIYSLSGDDHNSRWLSRVHASGEAATVFDDEYRCPVWVQTIAAACLELVNHPYQGVLHVAGAQRVNRCEFGTRLMAAQGVVLGDHIRRGQSPPHLARPRDCTLDISLERRLLETPLLGFDQVLNGSETVSRQRP